MTDRHSEADEPILVHDEKKRARLEAKNALLQADAADSELKRWLQEPSRPLRVSDILNSHRVLMTGLSGHAGNFRPAKIRIKGSRHTPPPADEVPRLMEEMCDYVNSNWDSATALHLSSYLLWRINWIHPFSDGNGRTARTISYLILSVRSGKVIPGDLTIPEQIASNKRPYYKALEPADKAFRSGRIDVAAMEELLESYLANQLFDYYKTITGKDHAIDAVDSEDNIDELLKQAEAEGAKDRAAVALQKEGTARRIWHWAEDNQGLISFIGILVAVILAIVFGK